MNDERAAEVVPRGERDELQRTARETGERMGGMDAVIAQHGDHLSKINGSIGELATSMAQQATSAAVMAVAVKNIEAALATDTATTERRRGISTQWLIAIFAAIVAFMGMGVTVVIALVVLIANGQL